MVPRRVISKSVSLSDPCQPFARGISEPLPSLSEAGGSLFFSISRLSLSTCGLMPIFDSRIGCPPTVSEGLGPSTVPARLVAVNGHVESASVAVTSRQSALERAIAVSPAPFDVGLQWERIFDRSDFEQQLILSGRILREMMASNEHNSAPPPPSFTVQQSRQVSRTPPQASTSPVKDSTVLQIDRTSRQSPTNSVSVALSSTALTAVRQTQQAIPPGFIALDAMRHGDAQGPPLLSKSSIPHDSTRMSRAEHMKVRGCFVNDPRACPRNRTFEDFFTSFLESGAIILLAVFVGFCCVVVSLVQSRTQSIDSAGLCMHSRNPNSSSTQYFSIPQRMHPSQSSARDSSTVRHHLLASRQSLVVIDPRAEQPSAVPPPRGTIALRETGVQTVTLCSSTATSTPTITPTNRDHSAPSKRIASLAPADTIEETDCDANTLSPAGNSSSVAVTHKIENIIDSDRSVNLPATDMGQIGVVQKTQENLAVANLLARRRIDLPRLTIPSTPSLNRRLKEDVIVHRNISPVGSSSSSSSDAAEVERILGGIAPEIVISPSPCRSDANDDVLPIATKDMLAGLQISRSSEPGSPCSPTLSSSTAPPSPALSAVPLVTLPDWKDNLIWTPDWLRQHRLGPDGLRPSKRRRLSKAVVVLLCNERGEYDVGFSRPVTPVNSFSTLGQLATDDEVAASERLAEEFCQLANDAQRELAGDEAHSVSTDDGSSSMDFTEPLYPAASSPYLTQDADVVDEDIPGDTSLDVVTTSPSSPQSPSFDSLDFTGTFGGMPMSSTPVRAGTRSGLRFLEEPTVAAIDFGVGEEIIGEPSSIPVDLASESILGQSMDYNSDDLGRHLPSPDSLNDFSDFAERQPKVVENITDGGMSSRASLRLTGCLPSSSSNMSAHCVAFRSPVEREDVSGSPSRLYDGGSLPLDEGSNLNHQPIPPTISEQSPSSDESYDLDDHLPPISPSSSCDVEDLPRDDACSDSDALSPPAEDDDSFELANNNNNLWSERLMDQTFEDEMRECDDFDFNFDPVSMSSAVTKQDTEHVPHVDAESVNSFHELIGNCSSTASDCVSLSQNLSTLPSPVTAPLLSYGKPQTMSSADSNECIGRSLSIILEEEEPDSSDELTSSTSLDAAAGDIISGPMARPFMREETPGLTSDTSFASPTSYLLTPESTGRRRFWHEQDSMPIRIPLPPLEYLKLEFQSLLSEELPNHCNLGDPIPPLLESELVCRPSPRDEEIRRIIQQPLHPMVARLRAGFDLSL